MSERKVQKRRVAAIQSWDKSLRGMSAVKNEPKPGKWQKARSPGETSYVRQTRVGEQKVERPRESGVQPKTYE